MRKRRLRLALFWVAFLVSVIGFLLYVRGPVRSLDFESEHLGDWTKTLLANESGEVVWYNPGYFQAYSENLTALISVTTSNGEIFLHVLNDTQLNVWRENKTVQNSLISQNLTNGQILKFRFEQATAHHFVLQNTLNTTVNPKLSISLEGIFLRFDYTSLYGSLLLLGAGFVVAIVLRKEAMESLDEFLKNWSLPKRESFRRGKHHDEERLMILDAYSVKKRALKYFVAAFAIILIILFARDMLTIYNMASVWNAPRPEYTLLLFDMGIRTNLIRAFLIAPLILCVFFYMILISPRLDDLASIVKAKLGMKVETEKRWNISRFLSQRILENVRSVRFLILCIFLVLPAILLAFFNSWDLAFLPYTTMVAAVLGTWSGYLFWTSFRHACITYDIREHAQKTYMRATSIDFVISGLLGIFIVLPLILFAGSDFWQSFLYSNIATPVLLLQQWPGFVSGIKSELVGAQGILLLCMSISLMGGLFFFLFPYIYKEGRRRASIAAIAFCLTYLTEFTLSAVFQKAFEAIQPMSLVIPILVAFFSWILQRRIKKTSARAVAKLMK